MIKSTTKSILRQNKRRIASDDEVKHDLKEDLPLLFAAFKKAASLYEGEIINTPPEARARGFEASLLNSKMIQSVQKYFPIDWRFGKYKRFILRLNGYNVLFKKLNSKNRPMNIPTYSVSAISNQLSLPLFGGEAKTEDPILFFGYKRDRIGNILSPQLVYLDEDRVKWIINEKDFLEEVSVHLPKENQKTATPILKKGKENDRKAG